MADTQIDELRLDVTIEDKTSGESSRKKVGDLAAAISRLNKAVDKFDAAKLSNVFNSITASIKPLSRELKGLGNKLNSLAILAQKSGVNKIVEQVSKPLLKKETVSTSNKRLKPVMLEQGKSFASRPSITSKGKKDNNLSTITSQVELWKYQLKQVQKELKNTNNSEENIIRLKSEELSLQDKIAKATKKNNVLLKSVARIAFYRLIRSFLKNIAQSFTQSISSISSGNKELNNSMTQITSGLEQVKASIGVALYQPLIMLTPVITRITTAITQFNNGLSYLFAKLRGSSTYLRINTQYMKEYQAAVAGTLLSFDTFETLSSQQGYNFDDMFEEVSTDASSLSKELGGVETTLKVIGTLLAGFATYKIITWIAGGGIKDLVKGLGNVKTKINDISEAGVVATSVFAFAASVINLIDVIKNWDSQSLVTKITAITAAALGLFAVIASIMALIPGFGAANVFKALAIGATAGATILGVVSAMKFANGGMMDDKKFSGTGTMYALAGESGAEVVARGSNGTGVLNVDQFADAMVSALVRYGAARDNGSGTAIEIDGNRLGTLIASSAGFRNEANRRNAGLNWK